MLRPLARREHHDLIEQAAVAGALDIALLRDADTARQVGAYIAQRLNALAAPGEDGWTSDFDEATRALLFTLDAARRDRDLSHRRDLAAKCPRRGA